MVAYEDNLYYHPENHDLEIVGTISWDDEPWQFEYTVVWRDSTGMFYWASDSGCSCPSPFEDETKDTLNRGSAHDAVKAVTDYLDELALSEWDYERRKADYGKPQVVELISKILR